MVEQLTTSQPFDLERTLRCGQGHRWLKDESDEGWYTAVFDSYWVRIRQLGGKHNPVQFDTNANTNAVEVKLRWHFRLDDPIEGIYADLSGHDAEMKALVERYQGLRVMRVDPWECLVFFILAVQRPIAWTQRQMEAIAQAFSNGAPPVTNGRYIFPTPPTIMNAQSKGSDKLRGLGLGLQKDKNIYRAAKVVDRTGNVAIAVASQLTGVADKTANCVTLFSLDNVVAVGRITTRPRWPAAICARNWSSSSLRCGARDRGWLPSESICNSMYVNKPFHTAQKLLRFRQVAVDSGAGALASAHEEESDIRHNPHAPAACGTTPCTSPGRSCPPSASRRPPCTCDRNSVSLLPVPHRRQRWCCRGRTPPRRRSPHRLHRLASGAGQWIHRTSLSPTPLQNP